MRKTAIALATACALGFWPAHAVPTCDTLSCDDILYGNIVYNTAVPTTCGPANDGESRLHFDGSTYAYQTCGYRNGSWSWA